MIRKYVGVMRTYALAGLALEMMRYDKGLRKALRYCPLCKDNRP